MTIHQEKRDRIEDKNRIIVRLNEEIEKLNQRIMVLELEKETGKAFAPHVFQVIRDTGKHYDVLSIVRVSCTPSGYELLVA